MVKRMASEATRTEMHQRLARVFYQRAVVQRDTNADDAMLLSLIQRELYVLTRTELAAAFVVVAGAMALKLAQSAEVKS